MSVKLLDLITNTQRVLHAAKGLLFELTLFLWAIYEMGKFVYEQVSLK